MSEDTQAVTGVIVRGPGGRFAKGTRPSNVITADTARSMVQKRIERHRQAAANRVMREAAAIDPTVNTPADAWGVLVARTYAAIMDSDKPRGDDMLAVGKAIGAVMSDADKQQAQAAAQVDGLLGKLGDVDALLVAIRRRVPTDDE